MIEVRAIKYYTISRYREVEGAQSRITKLLEKNPDHEYTILVNMRAYQKQYIVARIEHVDVMVPSQAEMDLPPLPTKPPYPIYSSNPAHKQAWKDYSYEQRRRNDIISKIMKPIKARLSGPFGS